MSTLPLTTAPRPRPPTARVTAAVLLAHASVIAWILHGLSSPTLPGAGEQVIMVSVVAKMPSPETARPAPVTAPAAARVPTPALVQRPAPTPLSATPSAVVVAPSDNAPSVSSAAPPSAAPAQASVGARAAPPGPTAVVPPSSDADYLNNPPPAYPRMSRRMGEQGTVLLRVLISAEGRAEQAEVRTSSGYARLDEAALETVKRWRYVPGKRAGVAEAMWFNVPIRFVLD